MIVKLTHPFLLRHYKNRDILTDCNKINTFCKNLDKRSSALFAEVKGESDLEKEARIQKINKFKGNGFELFVEAMIRLFPCDKRLHCIMDYEVETNVDIGVDGFGKSGINLKPLTVQCKYRQFDYVLSANKDHLGNFVVASTGPRYNVDQTSDPDTLKCNMIIISSAKSLNFFTDNEMFDGRVYAFCRTEIQQMVDNNKAFWEYFRESWKKSYEDLKPNSGK